MEFLYVIGWLFYIFGGEAWRAPRKLPRQMSAEENMAWCLDKTPCAKTVEPMESGFIRCALSNHTFLWRGYDGTERIICFRAAQQMLAAHIATDPYHRRQQVCVRIHGPGGQVRVVKSTREMTETCAWASIKAHRHLDGLYAYINHGRNARFADLRCTAPCCAKAA